jgi:hypothetical protein
MQENQTAEKQDEQKPVVAVAILKFEDLEDGTMSVEAKHDGNFEPMHQSHACLRAVIQLLPQICAPIGTRIDGNSGIRLPISDVDRYQALRTLALIPEENREAILAHLSNRDPVTEAEFDLMTDKIVEMCRGTMPLVVGAEQPAAIDVAPT